MLGHNNSIEWNLKTKEKTLSGQYTLTIFSASQTEGKKKKKKKGVVRMLNARDQEISKVE